MSHPARSTSPVLMSPTSPSPGGGGRSGTQAPARTTAKASEKDRARDGCEEGPGTPRRVRGRGHAGCAHARPVGVAGGATGARDGKAAADRPGGNRIVAGAGRVVAGAGRRARVVAARRRSVAVGGGGVAFGGGGWPTSAERIPSERLPGERLPGERAPANRAVGEWAPGQRAVGERAPGQRTVGDRTPGDRTPRVRAAARRWVPAG